MITNDNSKICKEKKMNLVKTLNKEEVTSIGEKFKQLVKGRDYHKAKEYLKSLAQDERDFLRKTEKYKSYLKTLSMSSL